MCLIIESTARARTATKPITVYKVLRVVNPYDGVDEEEFQSPYRDYVYQKGRSYSSRLQRYYGKITKRWHVGVGLHSFATQRSARKEAGNYGGVYCYVVVAMVIPTGAKYYVGKFGHLKCYVSSQLRWNEGVEPCYRSKIRGV